MFLLQFLELSQVGEITRVTEMHLIKVLSAKMDFEQLQTTLWKFSVFSITGGLRCDEETDQQDTQTQGMLSKEDPHQNEQFALPFPLSNTGGPQDKSTDGGLTYHMTKYFTSCQLGWPTAR